MAVLGTLPFLCLITFSVVMVMSADAYPTYNGYDATPKRDPSACAQDLIDWCRDQDFSIDRGVSQIAYQGTERMFSVSCSTSGTRGVECNIGGSRWFSCRPDNSLIFDGKPLFSNTKDREVCTARNAYFKALHDQKVQEENFKVGMNNFRSEMNNFQHKMNNWQQQMSRMFSGGFPFNMF